MSNIAQDRARTEDFATPRGHEPGARTFAALGLRLVLLLVATSAALVLATSTDLWAQKRAAATKFELKSASFTSGGIIPKQFTCDGSDVSPALSWTEPPPNTQSFALIMDDPDVPVGTFVHWVVYNLPATTRHLPEHLPGNDELQGGGVQGVNDFPMTGYGGPCPPPGKPHRYLFNLYALDTKLDLKAQARKKDVEQAMKGHVLAEATLMGRYGR